MSTAETIVNTTTQVCSSQAKVCCNPVVVGPRTGWSVRPASRARPEPVCLIPQGRILEGSTEVWLDPRELQASCVPRTGFAIPRTEPPKQSGLPRFNVHGGRRTQVWRDPAHFSRARCPGLGLPCQGDGCETVKCSDRSRCGPTSKLLALSGRVVPNEIVLRLLSRRQLRYAATLRVSVSRICLGRPPPATGPHHGGEAQVLPFTKCVRPWSEINEPEPGSAHCGMRATPKMTLSWGATIVDVRRSVGVFGPATF